MSGERNLFHCKAYSSSWRKSGQDSRQDWYRVLGGALHTLHGLLVLHFYLSPYYLHRAGTACSRQDATSTINKENTPKDLPPSQSYKHILKLSHSKWIWLVLSWPNKTMGKHFKPNQTKKTNKKKTIRTNKKLTSTLAFNSLPISKVLNSYWP